jgi:hypothetical protein
MHQILLDDKLYHELQRRASESGYATVDEYIAEILSHDPDEQSENLDHLFTPERLAHIDEAKAQIKSGNFYTSEQADAELARRRAEWLQENPR